MQCSMEPTTVLVGGAAELLVSSVRGSPATVQQCDLFLLFLHRREDEGGFSLAKLPFVCPTLPLKSGKEVVGGRRYPAFILHLLFLFCILREVAAHC